MNIKSKYLLIVLSFILIIFSIGFSYKFYGENNSKAAVQGIHTNNQPAPTATVAPTIAPTSLPTPTTKPLSNGVQPSSAITKQYGAWYWRSELGRAQLWLGTDKDGKEVWSDTADPTVTPTPQKGTHGASAQSTSSSETSTSGGGMSEQQHKVSASVTVNTRP